MTTSAMKQLEYEVRALKESVKNAITEFRIGYADLRRGIAEIKEEIAQLRGRQDIRK
jgi:hypothetical protein